MMKIGYYPGCTLKTKAKNLEDSALACLSVLGVDAEELTRWNCCGAVFSLADDDLVHHLAPVRDLIRAKDAGCTKLMTLCSMCYNTLARANLLMRDDEEKRSTLNQFMDEETDYFGEIEVIHYLSLLEKVVGWDAVASAVKVPLEGMRLAPYYGCTLLRPSEVAIEPPPSTVLFSKFIEALGAEAVSFPEATACCGAYQIVANENAALDASAAVLEAAAAHGADALALSCPLCEYNLGRRQEDIAERKGGSLRRLPTFYFTQLLAVALGLPREVLGLDLNEASSEELLRANGYLSEARAEA